MKRLAVSLARNQSVSGSTVCQRLCSNGQASGATQASSERSRAKRAEASSDIVVGSCYGGGRRERKRSTLSLPTVSAPEELQKALRKVLEGEVLCRQPPIVKRAEYTWAWLNASSLLQRTLQSCW